MFPAPHTLACPQILNAFDRLTGVIIERSAATNEKLWARRNKEPDNHRTQKQRPLHQPLYKHWRLARVITPIRKKGKGARGTGRVVRPLNSLRHYRKRREKQLPRYTNFYTVTSGQQSHSTTQHYRRSTHPLLAAQENLDTLHTVLARASGMVVDAYQYTSSRRYTTPGDDQILLLECCKADTKNELNLRTARSDPVKLLLYRHGLRP